MFHVNSRMFPAGCTFPRQEISIAKDGKCIFPTYEKRRTGFEADSPVDLSKPRWNYLAMVQCMKYL